MGSPGNYWKGYRVYDVLRFLVPAISDNKVTFESTYLTSNTFGIEMFMFDGFALANANSNPNITVTFREIVQELFKLHNVSFYIDQSDPDAPVLRLENADWFYNTSDVLSFTNPLKVVTSIKDSKYYGTIKTGSDYNPCGTPPTYTWNCGTSYYGWKEETYVPYQQCNTDNELDLVSKFIIASNAINDQVIGAVNSNLDSIFIVECWLIDDALFTAQATDYDTYAVAPERFYNIGLNNVNKVWRHGGNFQSALTNTANAGTDICKIGLGTDTKIMDQTPGSGLQSLFTGTYPGTPAVVVPIPFADEFGGGYYDPGGNWDNITDFIYTAPIEGSFSFKTMINAEVLNLKTCFSNNTTPGLPIAINIPTTYGVILTVDIEVYTDNTFGTLLSANNTNVLITTNGTYPINTAFVYPLSIGNVVRVRTQSQFVVLFPTIFGNNPLAVAIINAGICGYTAQEPKAQVFALADSYFECNGTPDGGLVLAQPDPQAYKAKQMQFDYDLTQSEIRTTLATPIGTFEVIKDEVSRFGWIEEMQINNWTGRSKIKLITQDATI